MGPEGSLFGKKVPGSYTGNVCNTLMFWRFESGLHS